MSVIPPTPNRKDYNEDPVYKAQAEANEVPIFDRDEPYGLFTEWLAEAKDKEPNDSNAMSVATLGEDGFPDVRMVLLKEVDERGFVFFTNFNSAKGRQLKAHPKAALCFHWKSLRRQVRVRGEAAPVSDAEADAYFHSRARGSRIGAWASDQSAELESREALKTKLHEVETRYEGGEVPRPPHWSGWRVTPRQIEFWRDRPYRLHDRLLFTKTPDGWSKTRLYP